MFYWHNIMRVLLYRGIGRPAAQGIHNSYCAGVEVYSRNIFSHRSCVTGKGGLERRTLRRWGFDFAVVVVAHTMVPVVVAIAHTMATVSVAGPRVGSVLAGGARGGVGVGTRDIWMVG